MEEKKLTGYPSIDKPWLKYYSEEAINAPLPTESLYTYMYNKNRDHLSETALTYFGRKISFGQMFEQINLVARAFRAQGVKPGDICTIITVSCVTSVLCQYALNKIGAVSNYINVLSSQEDLEIYFKDAESRVVVTLDLFAEKVISAAKQTGVERVISYSLGEWMPCITKLTSGGDDLNPDADLIVAQELAFVMNKQAEKRDMNTVNMDEYLNWIDEFDSASLFAHIADFIKIYTGSKEGTSTSKK